MNASAGGRAERMTGRALVLAAALLAGCAWWPGRDGAAKAPVATGGALTVIWSRDVDQRAPMSPPAASRPALAGGRVVIGGRDARVHVFDLHGGELLRLALDAPCESGALALSPGLVVLSDVEGGLYGVDSVHGVIRWKHALPSIVTGHPVAAGGDFLMQTADNHVYRFSAAGQKRWSFSGLAGGFSLQRGTSPLLANGMVYAVFSNGDVVALHADSGDLVWRRQLLLQNDAMTLSEMKTPVADPVMAGGVLAVSFFQGRLTGLSAADGEVRWQRNLSLKDTPLVRGDQLLVATGDGRVMALDAATGATLWQRKLDDGELVGPVASGGRLFVASSTGRVFALDAKGRVLGQVSVPGRVDQTPLAAAGGALVRTHLGGLYLIR